MKRDAHQSNAHQRIRRLLEKEYEGYVLVTCRTADSNGKMQVDMSYEGDPVLAAYLMEGAQGYLEEEDTDMELLS